MFSSRKAEKLRSLLEELFSFRKVALFHKKMLSFRKAEKLLSFRKAEKLLSFRKVALFIKDTLFHKS